MRYIQFTLTMPNRGSWNGKWSGENALYAKVCSITNKSGLGDAVDKALAKENYYYRWNDGWTARVTVTEIDAKEARCVRKLSKGFSGYDWMISSILRGDEEITYKRG